jgi:acyl carrier protein
VSLQELPLSPNGKVDRAAFPPPSYGRPQLREVFVAPRDGTERKVARIWSALLGVDGAGVHDNFFELGGHSLLAIELLAEIGKAFNVDLPPRSLFADPSIAGLSKQITRFLQLERGP